MPITQSNLLISYSWWIHVEKRERILIDDEEQNLNAEKSTDCADKLISDYAADEFITTAINAGDSTYFAEDAAGGLIAAIDAGNSTDRADILISKDVADGLITTDIDYENLTNCADVYAGGFINAINAVSLMDCADITVSDLLQPKTSTFSTRALI